jgi:hypothetical protein
MQFENFKQLTDTGKFRAVSDAELRADIAEGKLEKVRRYIFGAVLLPMDPDEIIARLVKKAEMKGVQITERNDIITK